MPKNANSGQRKIAFNLPCQVTAMKIAGFALAAFGVYLGTHATTAGAARAAERSA